MPDDTESVAKGSGTASGQVAGSQKASGEPGDLEPAAEHQYEEVAEYRIGEGPPPLPLVVMFALIVIWACVSWVPFFGY